MAATAPSDQPGGYDTQTILGHPRGLFGLSFAETPGSRHVPAARDQAGGPAD